MKKTMITFALLAGLFGASSCAKVVPPNEKYDGKELTLKVGQYDYCGANASGLKEGFKYAGMSDEDIFTVVPQIYEKGYNLYFPVETKELEKGLTVLEVTPEYLKVRCE